MFISKKKITELENKINLLNEHETIMIKKFTSWITETDIKLEILKKEVFKQKKGKKNDN